MAVYVREKEEIMRLGKESRRERLVVRLCGNVVATFEDAKAMGFSEPGIAVFQERYRIGDTATLPQLMRTGNPNAALLAVSVA